MLIDSVFSSDRAFYFGVKEEMGLTLRVATPIVVRKGNGRILSQNGGVNESGTWGKVDTWWDYAGPIDGRFAGVQLMSGQGNPEVWAHSRDYGVLVANPFPVDNKANRNRRTVVKAGEPFRLQFGVQVHEHGAQENFDPDASFQRYQELKSSRNTVDAPNL